MNRKIIVITGGTNGIGYQTVMLLANEKNNRVVVLDIDDSKIKEFNKDNIIYYHCNISVEEEVENAFIKIYEQFKKIDILVNNAGEQIVGNFDCYNANEYKKIMNSNYFGVCNCTFSALKYMGKGATILNVISVHSYKPRVGKYAYDCSKSAIECMTKELALELANKKITINAIAFGAVETNMNKSWEYMPSEKEEAIKKVPLKIIFNPKDIACFIKVILNSFSEYTTGSIFTIDGGRSLY